MDKCSLLLYIFRVIFVLSYVESWPSQENACDSIASLDCEYSCVRIKECSVAENIIDNGDGVACGFDGDTQKICCPNCATNRRSRRQTPPVWSTRPPVASKKDPYLIAQQKCVEYSGARYVNKTKPSEFVGRPPEVRRTLDCIKAEQLIYGGTQTKLKEFPHMALIGFNDRSERVEDVNWDCGGSLISERFVLSAAHCVNGGSGAAKWVRLGEYILGDPNDKAKTKDFRIIQRIAHPMYTSSSVYFDIALFKLNAVVTFSPHMRPICLYTASKIPPEIINRVLITGWGVTATGEQNSEVLLKASVNIVDDTECTLNYKNDKFLKNGYDPNTMVCAGDKTDGKDTCQGDSGGPLQIPISDWVCMYSQVGITSYGDFICGRKEVNAIYTKISYFVPWIQSIVWP